MSLVVVQPQAGDNPCASCKSVYGSTCCEVKDASVPRYPMTYAEANRIAKQFGVPIREAIDVRKVTKDEKRQLYEIAGEHVANLIVDGHGLYLPMTEDHACRYLARGGCSIPPIKPHFCALFPFSRHYNRWVIGDLVQDSGFCFGQDASGLSTERALEIFGESRMNRRPTRRVRPRR